MNVFVTVGTTEFDALIQGMTDVVVIDRMMNNGGVQSIVLQIGNGSFEPVIQHVSKCKVNFFRLKPTISEEMERADIIVSHAGAGSLFEALKMGKKVVAVVNESLMDNHQKELAEVLDREGHLVMTTPAQLRELFNTSEFFTNRLENLLPLPGPATEKFAQLVNTEMGFLYFQILLF